jgi:site-specific DNA recombinase
MNGSCTNSRSITRELLEARMLDGLRARLMAPEIAAEAMRTYAEETNRLNRECRASGETDRRELDKLTRSMKEIVTLIEDGGGSRALVARLRELEVREDELKARLAHAPVEIPDLHPNVAGIYRRKVERLAEALRHPQERDVAAEAIRSLSSASPSRPARSAARSPPRFMATLALSSNGQPKSRTLPVLSRRECRFQWLRGLATNRIC